MNREIKALILSAVFGVALDAESGSKITVFIYNYAVVSAEVLATTEAEVSRICAHAGIEIQWLECPLSPHDASQFPACQISGGPTRLAVRILSQSMAERLRQAEDSFAFALYPDDGSLAIVANVFAHDAEQLSNQRGISYSVILGHLVAHEMGHLLLGARSHSVTGIMHVPWRVKELEVIAQGRMLFTPAEAARMRTNIRVRIAAAEAIEQSSLLERGRATVCPASFWKTPLSAYTTPSAFAALRRSDGLTHSIPP